MFASVLRLALVPIAFQASIAVAQSAYFPPGFSESVERDPSTGLSVQLASGGKQGAPLLVLIHGLGKNASSDWLPVLPALARDYRILIFDLPGFGRSDHPDAALAPRKYADLLHGLIKLHSKEPVFVAGHSLGASVALLHSYLYPEQVERLLLLDAAGILQTAVYARHLTRIPARSGGSFLVDKVFNDTRRAINHLAGKLQDLNADNAEGLAALAGSDQVRGLLYRDSSNINAALALANEDFSAIVPRIRPPVWLLWGAQDRVAPLRTGQTLQWLLPAAQLTVLPNAGHVPMSESPAFTALWIQRSLTGPLPAQASGLSGHGGAGTQGDALCKGKRDQVYRGQWRSIRLDRCANARIENAVLGQLIAERSSVELAQVRIESHATAVRARASSITATGLQIVAAQAVELDNSRLDLAATRISAPSFGTDKNGSLVFFSLGYWCDGAREWRLHDVLRPRAGQFDGQLRQQGGAACAGSHVAENLTR